MKTREKDLRIMNDLLKVLDMSEAEQWKWLWENRQLTHIGWNMTATRNMILADLAFRLRDEAWGETGEGEWGSGVGKVMVYVHPVPNKEQLQEWWCCCSKPIHWIIAALIAKGKEDE